MGNSKITQCELCGSKNDVLNFHHLIPRTLHSTKWYTKQFSKDYMQSHGIWICELHCHQQIHQFISEKEMGREYNTLEKLLTHPKVAAYVEWRSKRV